MNSQIALGISCLLMIVFLAMSKRGGRSIFIYKSLAILFAASTFILVIVRLSYEGEDSSILIEQKFRASRNEIFGNEIARMATPGKVLIILTDFDQGNRNDFMKNDLPNLKMGLGAKHPVSGVVIPSSLNLKGSLGEPLGDAFNYVEFQSMLRASTDCQTVILVGNLPIGNEEAMREIDFFNPELDEPETFLALFSPSGLAGLDAPMQSGRLKLVSLVRPDCRYESSVDPAQLKLTARELHDKRYLLIKPAEWSKLRQEFPLGKF